MPDSSRPGDDLLPAPVPRRLGLISAAMIVVLLVGMILAGAVGGVDWLIGVGSAGTALGTLGLAYFTFTVAERTTALADSSQRLEAAANQELTAGREQARAAAATAQEAQRSRLDSLAPIVDLRVKPWSQAQAWERGRVDPPEIQIVPGREYDGGMDKLTFRAVVIIEFTNFGRIPALATMKHVGAAFDGQNEVIRVAPGESPRFSALIDYTGPMEDPFTPREVRYEVEVRGPVAGQVVDTIRWRGELTLLEPSGLHWRLREHPLVVTEYGITRDHGLAQ